MKLEVTKKKIKERYKVIIGADYCGLHHLLRFRTPFGYSAGAYGWSCDYYEVEGVCISTGYLPIASKNARFADGALMRYYNQAAREIPYSEEAEQKVNALLREFVQKATGEYDE